MRYLGVGVLGSALGEAGSLVGAGQRLGKRRQRWLLALLALGGLAALGGGSRPASAAPTPVVITTVCVTGGQGQLAFPFGGTCPPGAPSFRVDDPARILATCYLDSNGAIRKVTSSTDCTKAPRSKKETFLLVPSLTNDQYFCADNVGGRLYFKGTTVATCPSGQFPVVIKQANHPPVSSSQTVSLNEDASLVITLSASDVEDQSLTFSIVAGQGPTHGTVGAIGAANCAAVNTCTATVTYTPTANYFGPDSFKFRTNDGFANSADATVSITVTPVNDAPSFTKGADQTVLEDAVAQTVSGWATAISAGPANELGQSVSFNVTGNTNSGLFAAGPAVSSTGTLTYTPAANQNGTATITLNIQDDGGTANGGADTSASQTFTITVTAVNDAPSFTKGADQTVLEDAVAQTVSPWATAISAGPADESGQTVSFSITNNTNPGLFSAGPAVSSTGTLTYTPAANANGVATITLKAVDDGTPPAQSATQTFTITLTPVNDAPSFTKGADQVVPEDAGAQSVSGWATSISAGPANESGQSVSFNVTGNTNSGLFAAGPAVSSTGTLTFTPAPNQNGVATITLNIQDNGGTANGGVDTSAPQTFKITVTAVNDPPSFVKGADQTVLEDAVAQTVSPWATAISAGPADESGQTVSFSVTGNTSPGLFSAGPAVSSTGTLTYTPAANANGVATITLKAVDNGTPPAQSAPQTFSITVTPVNDAPSFDLPSAPDQSVVQDSPAQTVAAFATNTSPGPADESAQVLTFIVSNNNNALFSGQPDIDESTGDLTYTPAVGATGTATVSVYLADNGGTADGGVDTSATKTFAIVVFPPNATPVAQSQTGGNAVAATEDTVKTITLTATDADGNLLTFSIVGNPAKGTLGNFGTVSCSGSPSTCTRTVDYTPTTNANGPDSFTFKANDGLIDSNTATVDIAITAVNDAPSFVTGADDTVLEDDGAQSVTNWATSISAGPPDESAQTVTFNVTGNTNTGLFSSGPAVSSSGELTYTPAANANGSATIMLTISDSGGTANSGVDTSAPQSFVINVTAVNDAPSFTKGANQTVLEDVVAQSVSGWATAISVGPANEAGQTVTFNVTGNTNPSLFSAGPAVSSTGTLTYTPAANQNGSATITLNVQDNGGTADGGVDTSASQTFDITISAVNDKPVAQNKPATLATDVQTNMKRVAVDASLLAGVTDADTGVSGCSPTFSVASITSGSNGTVSNVNLGAGTFDFEPSPGFTGTATVNYTVSDNGCPGTAVSDPATISLGVTGPVIWFVNPAVTLPGTGTLADPFKTLAAADAVDAAGHRVFVYSGSTATGLTLNSGEWLVGQAATGTFDTFFGITPPTGTITRPAMGGGPVTIGGTVTLATNAKVQGVAISTGTSPGMVGSGGISGFTVSQSSITTTTGTALNLTNATIGSGGVTFTSISSNGAVNGIVLNSTGANGGLTVTGTGVPNSGGTIQNTTGNGISLTNTRDVSLTSMNIQSTAGSGVNGTGVTNFAFVNGSIGNSGDAPLEANIAFNGGTGFGNNIAGTLTVTGSTLTNGFSAGLDVQSDAGTVTTATISNNTVTGSGAGTAGISFVGTGNASTSFSLLNATINQNAVTSAAAGGIEVSIGNSNATGPGATAGVPGDATKLISITNNSVSLDATGANAIIVANSGGNSASRTRTNFLVQCNGNTAGPCTAPGPLNGSAIGTVVGVGNNGFSDMTGIVTNNVIDANHTPNLGGGNGIGGGNGVVIGCTAGRCETPDLTLTVTNNTITDTDGNGILLVGRNTTGIARLKIQNNNVAAPINAGGSARPGIRVDAGNSAVGSDDAVCLNISGNTSAGSNGAQGIGLRKQGTVTTTHDFSINGMAATATPGIEAYVNGLNPTGNGTLLISATSGFSNCSLP